MKCIEVYSPLDDLSVCSKEQKELVSAINHTLEITPNEISEYGSIRKTVSIENIIETNQIMKKYCETSFLWTVESVKEVLNKNLKVIKRLYELQGWEISCQHLPSEFSLNPDPNYDILIFDFNIE